MSVYNPMYQNYNNPYQMNPQIMNQASQFQIQNGGFISVASEEDARRYPVAPGNSVTFKNENAPYVYTKTMGFSQLDRPLFEKFRLVKEEDIKAHEEERNEEASGRGCTKGCIRSRSGDEIHSRIIGCISC